MLNAPRLLLLFFSLLLLHCLGNWELPLLDRDEPRFAEASREMLQRGDWIVPYCNGVVRFDKPPLIYWVQVASYKVFGENEFGARFPSAVFAAATSVILALWGARMGGAATGWRAALIFGLCLQTIVHARSAVADMAMVFFVALAAWAGWEALRLGQHNAGDSSGKSGTAKWKWLFWIALGFGFLAKGPIAWIPIGMAGVSGFRLLQTELRPNSAGFTTRRILITLLLMVGGCLLTLAIVGAWGIPALIRTHGEFATVGLGKHVVKRSVFALEGHGAKSISGWILSIPYYYVLVFASFFPWSIWLPSGVRHFWKTRKALSETTIYLLTGVVLIFAIFTFSRTKLPHYTLPAFPFLALLLAKWWAGHRSDSLFRKWVIGMVVAEAVVTLAGFALLSPHFPVRKLYRESASWLEPKTELAMTTEYQEPSIPWQFRTKLIPYQPVIKKASAQSWMEQPGPHALILPEEFVGQFLPQFSPDWKTARASGFNFVNARKVKLILVYKP